jgi:predicted ester cyclase
MSVEENKTLVRDFLEKVWNKGQFALVPGFIDPAYRAYALRTGHLVKGIEGVLANVQGVHRAFPGFRISVQDMFGEGDRVVTRLTMHATGETGDITMREIIIHRLENNKIIEAWSIGTNWD